MGPDQIYSGLEPVFPGAHRSTTHRPASQRNRYWPSIPSSEKGWAITDVHPPSVPLRVTRVVSRHMRSEKADGLATLPGLEMALVATLRDVDNVHGSISLTRDEQLVATKGHVHGLVADFHGDLLPE